MDWAVEGKNIVGGGVGGDAWIVAMVAPTWLGPLWLGPLWLGPLWLGPLWLGPLWLGVKWAAVHVLADVATLDWWRCSP